MKNVRKEEKKEGTPNLGNAILSGLYPDSDSTGSFGEGRNDVGTSYVRYEQQAPRDALQAQRGVLRHRSTHKRAVTERNAVISRRSNGEFFSK